MWLLEYSTQFKKDLKRYKHQTQKIQALKGVLTQLASHGKPGLSFKPHMLSGKYSGCMECHIQNDFLLIWIDEGARTVKLIRLGSHSDLFK
ncbi:MAG: type II toxin-antitoxin system YafQ family toxin [Bacteroidales bacterium]|nr:type II toxin-antitoxin system YafQ family toxin [Bacteroidales bacterium]